MSEKNDGKFWIGAFSILLAGVMAYQAWIAQQENHRLKFLNTVFSAENNILKDEIRSFEAKPTYDQGYKDALIRVGGPQNPGAYQDGWDDAFKVVDEGGYAEGYHAAIQQFGYEKNTNQKRWLIPEIPQIDKPKEEIKTASY